VPTSRRVALTGGIASGKSVVADIWRELGATVIDADELARAAVAPGTPGLEAIREWFPDCVFLPNGELDRARLGEIVFADPAARAKLEAIVHPEVFRLAEGLATHADGVVVWMIPLLVETGMAAQFDRVVVVDCDPELQVARLMARSGLSAEHARQRIAAQATREERLAAATDVIANEGSLDELRRRAISLYEEIASLFYYDL
jgi:dephospho-CoA kinase